MGVAEWSGPLLEWENELISLKERFGPVFGRRELRETGGAFIDGLLSGISRKTGWMMSEQAGLARPWRMQTLLGRSSWDADLLRNGVCDHVIESLGGDDGARAERSGAAPPDRGTPAQAAGIQLIHHVLVAVAAKTPG